MSGSGAEKRYQASAMRCAKLRRMGCTLSQIAELVGIEKEKVRDRIKLGERLMNCEDKE